MLSLLQDANSTQQFVGVKIFKKISKKIAKVLGITELKKYIFEDRKEKQFKKCKKCLLRS